MQMYTVVPKAKRGNAIVHPVNALLESAISCCAPLTLSNESYTYRYAETFEPRIEPMCLQYSA